MTRCVLATGNEGKLLEMQTLLGDWPVEIVSQSALGVESPPETGLTFVENALLKARHAAEKTQLPAVADDSGIEVDVLDGAPGIRSARYAGEEATDAENLALLLERMHGVPAEARTARFQCVIVALRHAFDPTPLIFSGTWEGRVLHAARGTNGFGYDPVFGIAESGRSAAELDSATKNRLSHRAQALLKLTEALPGGLGFVRYT